jgi:hypothetical protein
VEFERALLEVEQLASHCGKLAEINALNRQRNRLQHSAARVSTIFSAKSGDTDQVSAKEGQAAL